MHPSTLVVSKVQPGVIGIVMQAYQFRYCLAVPTEVNPHCFYYYNVIPDIF